MNQGLRDEIKRKIGQFVLGAVAIGAAIYVKDLYGFETFMNAAFCVVLIVILIDYLRVDLDFSPGFLHGQFLMRPAEIKGVHGLTFACLGGLLAFVFFDFDIALAAIAISIYGDGFAAIIGKRYGKTHLYNGKSLEGSIAMLLVALVVAFIFLKNIWLILAVSLAASVLELFVNHYPDDLVSPIYTGVAGQLLAAALGLRPLPSGYGMGIAVFIMLLAAVILIYVFSMIFRKRAA